MSYLGEDNTITN